MPFQHTYAIVFPVSSSATPDASDVTPAVFRKALFDRLKEIDAHGEWDEAIAKPYDTEVVEPERQLLS